MAKQTKCALCGKSFDSNELTLRSGKKYCKNCIEIKIQENENWSLLFEYICEIYNIEKPTGMMFKQLKEYRGEDYNYTDIGMYYTLKYYYEILDNKVLDGSGLGIIPYYYDKAKRHYKKVYDIVEIVENFENTEEIITIKTKIKNKELNVKKPISLDIVWGGGHDENSN